MTPEEIALAREYSRREVAEMLTELGVAGRFLRPGEAVKLTAGVAVLHEAKSVFEDAWGLCGQTVMWWDGEYEGDCELLKFHNGDHFDGLSWFDDNGDCTDHLHEA